MKIVCAVDQIRKLKPNALKDILNKDKNERFLILDVRQPSEYGIGHIPKAMLVPLAEIKERVEQISKEKIIVTYSRSGYRSVAAAIALHQLGFRSLLHLDGGISRWTYGIVNDLPEIKTESVKKIQDTRDIYMEGMAIELGFKNPPHLRDNKTLNRARKAIINLVRKKPMSLTKVIDLRNILVLSIKLEKASREYYKIAIDKAASPQVEDILKVLFNAKDEHIYRLYTCACSLAGEDTLSPLKQFVRELVAEHYEDTIEVNPFIAKVYTEFTDELELLETAVEKEYVSYDFFLQASEVTGNEEVKSVLYECAMEEQRYTGILLERIAEVVPEA